MPKPNERPLQRLGERIQRLRQAQRLTQEELASRCGITQKYLSDLERGERAPSWETLVALAHKGFGIKLATLVFGIDDDGAHTEAQELVDILAGRPDAVKHDVLKAVRLLLRAGEGSK